MTALAEDEVWAAQVLDMEEAGLASAPPNASERPSVLHYSPVIARMDMLADRLLAVRTAVQAGYTKEHQEPEFNPLPRPETAIERERERRTRNLLLELDAVVRGDGLVVSAE